MEKEALGCWQEKESVWEAWEVKKMTEPWVQRGKQAPGFSHGENCPFAIIIPTPKKAVVDVAFQGIGIRINRSKTI